MKQKLLYALDYMKIYEIRSVKVKGAVGYDIYRYDPSSKVWEKCGVVGKKSGKAVFTDNNVTSGTSYKYKIRAYGRLNGRKVPGKMSEVFKAKASKIKAIR